MTPRLSLIGMAAQSRWFSDPWRRRPILIVLLVVFAILTIFPRQYRAAVTMTPLDASSAGLAGALGQLGAVGGLLGASQALEVDLKIARSMETRQEVAKNLDLGRRLGISDPAKLDRWVEGQVNVRSLRGGILQVETTQDDPDFARTLVAAYADATRDRLANVSREQTAYKRRILTKLVADASDRLAEAQGAYNAFRNANGFVEPGSALGSIGTRVPALQAQLKAKEMELQGARAFATDQNMKIQQILVEMAAMRTQLHQAESENRPEGSPNVAATITKLTQLQRLQRELSLAQGLYDSYSRYLEGTDLEDLTANANIRVLEPPYVDSDLQFRPLPLALAALVLIFGLAVEFYTARPPVGAVRAAA